MSLLSRLFGGKPAMPAYTSDELTINGKSLKLTFFAHASVALEYEGRHIYVDPVMGNAESITLFIPAITTMLSGP